MRPNAILVRTKFVFVLPILLNSESKLCRSFANNKITWSSDKIVLHKRKEKAVRDEQDFFFLKKKEMRHEVLREQKYSREFRMFCMQEKGCLHYLDVINMAGWRMNWESSDQGLKSNRTDNSILLSKQTGTGVTFWNWFVLRCATLK